MGKLWEYLRQWEGLHYCSACSHYGSCPTVGRVLHTYLHTYILTYLTDLGFHPVTNALATRSTTGVPNIDLKRHQVFLLDSKGTFDLHHEDHTPCKFCPSSLSPKIRQTERTNWTPVEIPFLRINENSPWE